MNATLRMNFRTLYYAHIFPSLSHMKLAFPVPGAVSG